MERIHEKDTLVAEGKKRWEEKLLVVLTKAKNCTKKEVKAMVSEVGRKPVEQWSGELLNL